MQYEFSSGGIVYRKVNNSIEWLICLNAEYNKWVFPKGLIADHKRGESIEEAALREVEEEGGVKAKIIERLIDPIEYFYKRDGILRKKTVYYFLMEYVSGDPKNHDQEMQDAGFFLENEVKERLGFKNDLNAFTHAIQVYLTNKANK